MNEKKEKLDSGTKEKSEETEFLFMQFISGLYTSAMQHLGKLMNPLTGKVERNLEAAQSTIELVRMLKEKTEGNLTKRESDTISNALANMQMNYVDELKRKETDKGDKGGNSK